MIWNGEIYWYPSLKSHIKNFFTKSYLSIGGDNVFKHKFVDGSIISLLGHLQTKQCPCLHLRGLVIGINLQMWTCLNVSTCFLVTFMFSTDTTVNFLCTYSFEYQNDLHTINGNLLHNVDFLDITYQVI